MSTIKNIAKANSNARKADALAKKNTHKNIAMGVGGGTTVVGAVIAGLYGRKLKKDFKNLKADNDLNSNKLTLIEQINEAQDKLIAADEKLADATAIKKDFEKMTAEKAEHEELIKNKEAELAALKETPASNKDDISKLESDIEGYKKELESINGLLDGTTEETVNKAEDDAIVECRSAKDNIDKLNAEYNDKLAQFKKERDEAVKSWWQKHKDKKNNKKNNNGNNNNNGDNNSNNNNNNGANNDNNGNGSAK